MEASLYPLKTSENRKVKGALGTNGLNNTTRDLILRVLTFFKSTDFPFFKLANKFTSHKNIEAIFKFQNIK